MHAQILLVYRVGSVQFVWLQSFVGLDMNKLIRITNEERSCFSSLTMLILIMSAILSKGVPAGEQNDVKPRIHTQLMHPVLIQVGSPSPT